MTKAEMGKTSILWFLDLKGTPREINVVKFMYGIPMDNDFNLKDFQVEDVTNELPTLQQLWDCMNTIPHTPEETAQEFGLKVTRIKQIEAKVLRLNRRRPRQLLEEYFE